MRKVRYSIIAILTILTIATQAQTVSLTDLEQLFDVKMSGELIYMDYQSNDEVSIPVKLTITKKNDSSVNFAFQYPGEASANNTQKVKITGDGNTFNNETVTERQQLKNGGVQFATLSKGKDNGRNASFVTTYIILPTGYSSEKLVKYEDGTKLLRNRYVLRVPKQ